MDPLRDLEFHPKRALVFSFGPNKHQPTADRGRLRVSSPGEQLDDVEPAAELRASLRRAAALQRGRSSVGQTVDAWRW